MPDPIAINYSREFGWSGTLTALISPDQEDSVVVMTHNFDGGTEIGKYRTSLPPGEFSRALDALRRSGYDRLPGPSKPVPPETCFLNVGERREGEPVPTMRGFVLPHLPDPVAVLRDELEAGPIAEIRKHRARVVSGRAAWLKQVFDPREPLAGRVKLVSTGTLPVVIGNPLDPNLAWTGLGLALRNTSGEEDGVRLTPVHLRPPPGAPQSGEATLAPGGILEFTFEKKVYLPAGTYEGHLLYRNMILRDGDPQFVEGELSMPLGPVTIESPRRW